MCSIGVAERLPSIEDWIDQLESAAAAAGLRDLVVRAHLHRAALGHKGALAAAKLLAQDLDNPTLRRGLPRDLSGRSGARTPDPLDPLDPRRRASKARQPIFSTRAYSTTFSAATPAASTASAASAGSAIATGRKTSTPAAAVSRVHDTSRNIAPG